MSRLPNNKHILREIAHMVCGRRLGSGIARKVYVFEPDPELVIKLEEQSQSFQNVKEWEVWQAAQETKHVARWLAPCVMISPCGSVMLQKRTWPAAKLPVQMPSFLTDFKKENYGELDGRLVCHDYGMHLLLERGMTKRMRKADWWSHEPWDS